MPTEITILADTAEVLAVDVTRVVSAPNLSATRASDCRTMRRSSFIFDSHSVRGLARLTIGLAIACGLTCANAGAAVAAPGERKVIGTCETGMVYWHGHPLTPPFVFTIDPISKREYVNQLPFALPDTVREAVPSDTMPDPREILLREVFAQVQRRRLEGASSAEMRQLAKKLLLQSTQLVNKVETDDTGDFSVLWKGETDPVHLMPGSIFAPLEKSPPAPPRVAPGANQWLTRQDVMLEHLASGGILLIGNSHVTSIPNSAAMRAELDSIRHGKTVRAPRLKNPETIKALRSPRPIAEILRRGDAVDEP